MDSTAPYWKSFDVFSLTSLVGGFGLLLVGRVIFDGDNAVIPAVDRFRAHAVAVELEALDTNFGSLAIPVDLHGLFRGKHTVDHGNSLSVACTSTVPDDALR